MDYEANPGNSKAWIRCAMIHLMAAASLADDFLYTL